MLALCPDTVAGKRDRALLALGFAGAFRRSELVALQVEDLAETAGGLRVTIRRPARRTRKGRGPRWRFLEATGCAQSRPCRRGWPRRDQHRPGGKQGRRVQTVPLTAHGAA
jgi:integrase